MSLIEKDYKLIKGLLQATQESLISVLGDYLISVYGEEKVVISNDYLVAYGTIPVGLVAHLDTVHTVPVQTLLYDREQNIMWSPQGLGADDRAGVYAILEILNRGLTPTVIFTTDEEVGGIGASRLVADIPTMDLNYLIELDRRGEDDCVFYDCDNEDFEKHIEKYGFRTNFGSYSDIDTICRVWKMAGVNLSIGYTNEHSKFETLNVNWMNNTIDKVCTILNEVKEEDYFVYIPTSNDWFSKYNSNNHSYLLQHVIGENGYGIEPQEGDTDDLCQGCIGIFPVQTLIDTDDGLYCGDCYAKNFTSCIICESPFLDSTKTHLYCEKCRENYGIVEEGAY